MLPTRFAIPSPLLPLIATALLGGCATMPEPSYPPFAEHEFALDFVADEHGHVILPETNIDLVVRQLRFRPEPLDELFGDHGSRFFLFAPGQKVTARGSLRIYGDDQALPSLQQIFPNATLHPAETGEPPRQP